MDLIDNLIKDGWLKSPRIITAFKKIKRIDFLPEESKDLAELNTALPIGYGQTISQPLVVAFMLEQLEPQPGEKILDVGSGSGWTSALLAEIVGKKENPPKAKSIQAGQLLSEGVGRVIAIELIPELAEFGRKNISKYNFIEKGIVKVICTDASKGYQKQAPFDRILASASANKVPSAWKEQLRIGGKIVTPIGSSIFVLTKKSDRDFETEEHPGFIFVPLIEA